MAAYYPVLIAASHSFHTHDGSREESRPYLESVINQKRCMIQITEKVVPLVRVKSEFME